MSVLKYYSSGMRGAPQIDTANWGSMLNLFDTVLVNGWNIDTPVTKIKTTNIINTIELYTDTSIFSLNQTIKIYDCTDIRFNKEYLVTNKNSEFLTIESKDLPQEIIEHIDAITKVKVAPCGMTLLYSDDTKKERGYKLKDYNFSLVVADIAGANIDLSLKYIKTFCTPDLNSDGTCTQYLPNMADNSKHRNTIFGYCPVTYNNADLSNVTSPRSSDYSDARPGYAPGTSNYSYGVSQKWYIFGDESCMYFFCSATSFNYNSEKYSYFSFGKLNSKSSNFWFDFPKAHNSYHTQINTFIASNTLHALYNDPYINRCTNTIGLNVFNTYVTTKNTLFRSSYKESTTEIINNQQIYFNSLQIGIAGTFISNTNEIINTTDANPNSIVVGNQYISSGQNALTKYYRNVYNNLPAISNSVLYDRQELMGQIIYDEDGSPIYGNLYQYDPISKLLLGHQPGVITYMSPVSYQTGQIINIDDKSYINISSAYTSMPSTIRSIVGFRIK